jgi:hypothetical protein
MRIAFVTSSLEPGRDGVGDYTRDLANECHRQGHDCSLVALNDRHLNIPVRREDFPLPSLRLNSTAAWADRVKQAGDFLAEQSPDWLSLQFVCFGFHDRGLVWDLAKRGRSLAAKAGNCQIMFHELWVGERNDTAKNRLLGLIQQHFVLRLYRSFAPRLVHTSNPRYASRLSRHRIPARILPLFGAIPVTDRKADGWLPGRLAEAGGEFTPETRNRYWLFGIFGTLHPVWPPEPLLSRLKKIANRQGRELILLSIGRIGSGNELWQRLRAAYSPEIRFLQLGELSADEVSEVFNSLDFGIATTPLELLGKSASAAAMLEHGLPVIVNRDEAKLRRLPETKDAFGDLVIKMDENLEERLLKAKRLAPKSMLSEIAARFLQELQQTSSGSAAPAVV